jgi:Fe-S cluster assembly protein SufD
VAHCKVQREAEAAFHTGTVEAAQDRDSHFHSMSLSVGGALVRNDINTTFLAPGGQCSLDGLYLASGGQHVDHHTSIDHRAPRCRSEELYKGVLDGRATAVFNGKVFVRHDAQKSDAQQANKNLLLSEEAVVNTKPQLEIFADDVKCSHGATIGRLDEDALFYLRSRGIDESAARTILVRGFVNQVIERIPVEGLRAQFESLVRSRVVGPTDSEDDA